MEIFDIIFPILITGGAFMVFGILLMILFFLIDWLLPRTSFFIIDKVLLFGTFSLQFGVFLFLSALAGLSLSMAIDGLFAGEYILNFNRIGSSKTIITWEDRPFRFVFQTVVFIGFSAWIIRYLIKMFRDVYQKNRQKN